jgi:hypothetical protein
MRTTLRPALHPRPRRAATSFQIKRRAWRRCARRGWPHLRRYHQMPADLLGRVAAGEQAEHLYLACGQPARLQVRAGARWPAAVSTASTAVPSSRPAMTSARRVVKGPVGIQLGTVRTRLGHGVIGVGRSQRPVGRRERGRRQASRVARAVRSFVAPWGDLPAGAEHADAGQHAIGQVRVQAYALGLGLREGSCIVPDRVGDSEPASGWSGASVTGRP